MTATDWSSWHDPYDEPGSYAGADLPVSSTQTVEYGHSIGEIVTAALSAGLRLQPFVAQALQPIPAAQARKQLAATL